MGIYFIFGTKSSWNEGIDTCFNVECVLLGRNFDFLNGYLVVTACYLVATGRYLVVTGSYWWLLLVPTFSMNVQQQLIEFPTLSKETFAFLCYKKKRKTNFFGKLKPFLSEKTKSREKIILVENEKLVSYNTEVANCHNIFFSNIVKNLGIPKCEVKDNFHQNIESPTLKVVLKYRNHPSIISISHSFHQTSSFNFSCIDKNTILKEIKRD